MKNSKLVGGILLVAGTTIGAGMLALPISTGLAGFWPGTMLFAFCWLVMLWVGGIFLELNLSVDGEVNLISIAKGTIGSIGALATWVVYLLLMYALLAAYMVGSGQVVHNATLSLSDIDLPSWSLSLPITMLFAPFVYVGLRSVDFINRYLMLGLVLSYIIMVILLTPEVNASLLANMNFDYLVIALTVVITSFGYHVLIPSLTSYLDRDVKKVKICVALGSLIPFIVYVVWEYLILGIIPAEGDFSIAHMLSDHKLSLTKVLQQQLGNSLITSATGAFAIFAITTSFIGVAIGLFDFLRDGLKIQNTSTGRLMALCLTFVPPVVFTLVFQKGFVTVLQYAGVLVAILIGILPLLMVWSARYVKKLPSPYRVMGGKLGIIFALCFFVAIIGLEFARNLGYFAV